jgi:hypothetical protein
LVVVDVNRISTGEISALTAGVAGKLDAVGDFSSKRSFS